jgi:hypothetical protein
MLLDDEIEIGVTTSGNPGSGPGIALAKRRGRSISRANQAFLDWVAFTL